MRLFELSLGLGLLRVHHQVSQHEKDYRCQIGEAPDVEPGHQKHSWSDLVRDVDAKHDKIQQQAAHANQQRRNSTFEHSYRAQCQHQIEIQCIEPQCEVKPLQNPLHDCNEQTLEQEIEPEEPGLYTLRKPTPEQKAIECCEQEKDEDQWMIQDNTTLQLSHNITHDRNRVPAQKRPDNHRRYPEQEKPAQRLFRQNSLHLGMISPSLMEPLEIP